MASSGRVHVSYNGIPVEKEAWDLLQRWGVTEADIERMSHSISATPGEFGDAVGDVAYGIQYEMDKRSDVIGSTVTDPSYQTVMDRLYEGCIMYIDSRSLEHARYRD